MAFTSRSVNLSWAPPLNNHNSLISHYRIQIREGEGKEWDDNKIIDTPDNRTVFQVRGCLPFTTYSFRVMAVNGKGKSHFSTASYYMLTLREVPSGKPSITSAHNMSSTSIQLTWVSPPLSTIHGEFLGYVLRYKPRMADESKAKEIRLKDSSITKHTITKLKVFTQYSVSLQVENPEGQGNVTTVIVMTDEGVPSMPVNVSLRNITNSSILIHWRQPTNPNGIIIGYRLYYMHKDFTDVETVRRPQEHMQYRLSGLKPYTNYKLWLKAFTWKNEGEPSEPFTMMTDVRGPSPPTVSNLTCCNETSIFVEWDKPKIFYKSVDNYYIHYRKENAGTWKEIEVIVERTTFTTRPTTYILTNLTTNSLYEIKVQGATKGIYDSSKLFKGQETEIQKFRLRQHCDHVRAFTMVLSKDSSSTSSSSTLRHLENALGSSGAGALAGVFVVALALFFAVVILGIWRRYFNEAYYYLDEGTVTPVPASIPDWDIIDAKRAVPTHVFIQRVAAMHMDINTGFAREFQEIEEASKGDISTSNASNASEHIDKNRYNNILAYDHSRVQLRPLPGQKKGEYLNANFIDGFQKARNYIATQGPLPSTYDSFWRMIWEQKVYVVVMITNLLERGRRKCDMYWPNEGKVIYGLMEVTLIKEEIMATYTIRQFSLRHTRMKKINSGKHRPTERTVYQYQYTNWPDNGIPDNPLPVVSFVKKSSDLNRDREGPLLVHCSAGVGRTGAYILIDAILKQLKSKGEANIYTYLKHIRTQRNHLVQSEEQYAFVHDAMAEAIASGETNVNASHLSRCIDNLQSSFTTDENSIPWQLLDRQFKLATSYTPPECQFVSALGGNNRSKNRNFDFLPIEKSRVRLSSTPDGSDYINASWIPGFHSLREFVVTQHPLESTVADFWRMIWDHSVSTIVVLSSLQKPEFGVFWPAKKMDMEHFRVELTEETTNFNGYESKQLKLSSFHSGNFVLNVKIIFRPDWPRPRCLENSTDVTELPRLISALYVEEKEQQPSPTVIMDRFGGTESGIFCALSSLLSQLDSEHHVDVYQAVKYVHNQRPGTWRSQEDLLYIYKVLESVCTSRSRYPPEGVEETQIGDYYHTIVSRY
ncbi:putative receptor-type tyrosine-protein phosphatase mosPTP-1 isoform X2 [Lepeophtheirus salmonis]